MPYVPFELSGFAGGLNTELDATSLELNELSEALNVRIGNKGEVERRTGYSRFDQASLPAAIFSLYRWVAKDGNENLLAGDINGDLWCRYDAHPRTFVKKDNLGSFNLGVPFTYPIAFAAGEDNLYISSLRGTSSAPKPLKRWNGTILEDVTAIYDPSKDPNDDNKYIKPPVGQQMVYRHGRLMIAHTVADTSRIWFSNHLQPERFREQAWIDLDPEDGSSITAMISFADELIIFKDNSMWELTGRDPTMYSLRTVDKLRGTVSPGALCQMRGALVFFDRDTGVWSYDGSSLTLISEKINKYLLGGIDYSECHRASAYFGDDRYYLSLPWEGRTGRTFVMNAQNGAWSEYDNGFSVGDFHNQQRLQGYSTLDGLYLADETRDDIEGLPDHVSRFRTGWLFPVGEGAKARMRRLELVVDAIPTSLDTFTVELFRELNDKDPHVTREFHTEQLLFETRTPSNRAMHQVALDGWGKRWHSMQLAVTMTHIPSQVNRMTVFISAKVDERGERRA